MIMKTGIKFFDDYLGGLESSTMTLLYGSYGVGKTNFCLIATVNFLRREKDKKVVFIDTDSSFSIERIKQLLDYDEKLLKDITSRIIIYTPTDFVNQRKIIMNLSGLIDEIKEVGFVVVDSLTMLYRFEFNRENSEINLIIAKLIEIARKREIPMLVTSQTYIDFDNKNLRIVGGEVMLYAAKMLIHLEKIKASSENQIDKNRLSIEKARNVKEKSFFFKINNKGFEKI